MKSLTQSHMLNSSFRPFALLLIFIVAGAGVHASAASQTWDPSLNKTGSDGAGTWNTTAAVWANGTADQVWANTTSSTAIFGGSYSSTVTASAPAITVGSVNVGTIIFNQPAGGLVTYKLTGSGGTSTINGSGTMTIDGTIATTATATPGPEAVFGNNSINGTISFTGASTYLFQTLSGTSANEGVQLSGVSFNGGSGATIQLGNGSDVGQLVDYNTITTSTFGTNSVIVNNGWELLERNSAVNNNASLTLNGFGTAGTTDRGALRIQPQSSSAGPAWSGAITLGSDAMIVASGTATNSVVSGNIGGSHNLFVGGGGLNRHVESCT